MTEKKFLFVLIKKVDYQTRCCKTDKVRASLKLKKDKKIRLNLESGEITKSENFFSEISQKINFDKLKYSIELFPN